MPEKYRRLGDFSCYYSGEKTAPILTLVIGGNHEASNYMWELYYGGWLAPNIYYLGAAGCVRVGGLLIAGASGIFKANDYQHGHFERMPYNAGSMRSIYHTRQFDITKLALADRPDIFLSHDWPNGIEQHGDVAALLKRKPFFRREVESQTLGSPPLASLLDTLRPQFWFSAHLHVCFAARVVHDGAAAYSGTNPEVLSIDDDSGSDDDARGTAEKDACLTTDFLALSKCMPGVKFLHFFELPAPQDSQASDRSQRTELPLHYDRRWLAITKAMHPYFSTKYTQKPLPLPSDASLRARIDELISGYSGLTEDELDIRRVQTFRPTAPLQRESKHTPAPPPVYRNAQTDAFCTLAGIPNGVYHEPRNGGAASRDQAPKTLRVQGAMDAAEEIAKIRAASLERKRKRERPKC